MNFKLFRFYLEDGKIFLNFLKIDQNQQFLSFPLENR